MIQALFPVCLQPSTKPKSEHPLHAVISLSSLKLHGICINENEHQFIAVIIDESIDECKNVFINVHAFKLDNADSDIEVLDLFVTPQFLEHYCYSYDQNLFFKRVQCLPISRIVFGAKNEKCFTWCKEKKWRTNILEATHQCPLLCRLDDVLLVSPKSFSLDDESIIFDLKTVICEPVNQGIITKDTTIIVVNIENKITELYHNFKPKISKTNYLNSDDTVSSPEHDQSQKLRKSLKVIILPEFDQLFQKALLDSEKPLDLYNTAFVSSDAFEEIGCQSGDFVEAKLANFDDSEKLHFDSTKNAAEQPIRLVTICCIDKYSDSDESHDTVYITPHLWFNLNSHPSRLLQPNSQLIIQPHTDSLCPPYAKEIFVALVQSPMYGGTIDCNVMLKNYFKNPRYLCKGDLICLETKNAVDFQQKNEDATDMSHPVVYFRVSMIEGPSSNHGFLVSIDRSKLYQAGTVQSYVPMTVKTFHSASLNTYFSSPSPPGLEYHIDILQEVIEPLLNIQNQSRFQMNSNIIITGSPGCGKTLIVYALCKRLNLQLYQVNCHELLGENSATMEAKLKIVMEKASIYAPCILLLKNIEFVGKEKELKGENSRVLSCYAELLRGINKPNSEWPVVVIATSSQHKLVCGDLSAAFLHIINIEAPQQNERTEMLESLTFPSLLGHSVSFDYLAQRTAGFHLADLSKLVLEAGKNLYMRFKNMLGTEDLRLEEDATLAGFPIVQKDFLIALEKLQSDKAKSSGAPSICNVSWNDIGGLENVKQEILDTIQLPLDYPELLSAGLRRSGVLLYGPPGTGKTLLAKAVATECSLNFMSIKGPELINMYVGQSEGNVRAVFEEARNSVPCIIFFDELDSLAPNRGRSGDSGGVMDRVVSQLLSEIDGLSSSAEVFVIGATNRPDLIDPALLRPGRFDRLVYVGIPSDLKSRMSILKALTRKMKLSDDVELEEIVGFCPGNVTGADFYSLCSDAMMNSIAKNVELIEKGELKLEDASVSIGKEDFLIAAERLVPSVSEQELARYEKLKLEL